MTTNRTWQHFLPCSQMKNHNCHTAAVTTTRVKYPGSNYILDERLSSPNAQGYCVLRHQSRSGLHLPGTSLATHLLHGFLLGDLRVIRRARTTITLEHLLQYGTQQMESLTINFTQGQLTNASYRATFQIKKTSHLPITASQNGEEDMPDYTGKNPSYVMRNVPLNVKAYPPLYTMFGTQMLDMLASSSNSGLGATTWEKLNHLRDDLNLPSPSAGKFPLVAGNVIYRAPIMHTRMRIKILNNWRAFKANGSKTFVRSRMNGDGKDKNHQSMFMYTRIPGAFCVLKRSSRSPHEEHSLTIAPSVCALF